jgi:SRSO17 transposase
VVSADLGSWVAGLDELFARVAGRFGRVEPRRQARAYLTGLLAPVERKNGWQLAEAAGDATPDKMQRLLNAARWDPDAVRDDLRDYVAVFCAYATGKGRALIDRELYLPKSWTDNRPRMHDAGVPEDYQFATKQVLAIRMLARALEAATPAAWVTADEAYGHDSKFRRFLGGRAIGYVVAIPRNQPIHTGSGSVRADTLVAGAPEQAWKRLSAGAGSKGQRLHDWAMAALPGHDDRHDKSRWLLARRSLTDPDDLAFYLCAGPDDTTIDTLVRVAGTRWTIEECFKHAKGETGLDHYQVRRYHGWYRHITLSMLAYAYLAVTAATDPKAAATWSASAQQRSAVSWYT